jgi:hypothetical protein
MCLRVALQAVKNESGKRGATQQPRVGCKKLCVYLDHADTPSL